MLDIGWSELLVVAIVAIVVVGPKDLPRLMRTFGTYAGKIRRAAGDFQRQFEEAMAESEADEVRKNIEAIRANMGTAADFNAAPDKPLMTGEPARTAVGAPPLDSQQAKPPKRAKKRTSAKTSKTAKTQRPKPAPRKAKPKVPATKAKRAAKAATKTSAKRKTKR